jgi:mevalonate kinase
LLGATDAGLGGCIIASIKREELSDELSIPDNFDIF